jgi:peptidyl-prolyl cis-trans isomerase C
MKPTSTVVRASLRLVVIAAAAATAALAPLAASAQNVAIVNGKAVPKTRVDALIKQAQRAGQQVGPEVQQQARDQVVLREIFAQEAERRGVAAGADYREAMEIARQSILIRELFEDFRKKNPVTDDEALAEYNKFRAQASGTEYRARHILVEKEEEAVGLIKQIKGGGKFDELAKKHSKDTGSGEKGGDLDYAKPDSYVPEFGKALVALKKGEMTETPVKSQFGFHIILLEDVREAPFPAFDDVKGQLKQRLEQQKLQKFQEELRTKAKTDYKFGS